MGSGFPVAVESGEKGEAEGGSSTGLRFDPDAAAVPFHDLPANGESDSRSRVLLPAVEALEDLEDSVPVPLFDADAVVLNGDHPMAPVGLFGRQVDLGAAIPAELDGISDEVLEKLHELGRIAFDFGQGIVEDGGSGFLYGDFQVGESIAKGFLQLDGTVIRSAGSDAGIDQQVIDELLHAPGSIDREADEVAGVVVELSSVTPLQELDVTGDHAQGFLEIVRGDVGELFQVAIAAFEFDGAGLEFFLGAAFRGDVPVDSLHADDRPGGVVHGGFDDADDEALTAGGFVGFLGFEGFAGVEDALVVGLVFGGEIRGEKVEIGASDDVFARLAGVSAEIGIGESEAPLKIFSEDVLDQVFDERFVEGLGIAQGFVGAEGGIRMFLGGAFLGTGEFIEETLPVDGVEDAADKDGGVEFGFG